jgi:hypothetical protein
MFNVGAICDTNYIHAITETHPMFCSLCPGQLTKWNLQQLDFVRPHL